MMCCAQKHNLSRLNVRRFLCGVVLSTCLSLCQSAAFADNFLVLSHAKLVGPSKKTVTARSILIRNGHVIDDGNGRIGDVHPTQTIDCSGKWVIPGLIDLHDHCGGNPLPNHTYEHLGAHATAKVMLYCGVCAYLDLAYSDFPELFAARDEQRKAPAKFTGESDIYCAGTALGRWSITAANAAEKISQYVKKWKPDVIKLIYGRDTMDCATLTAAVKGAAAVHMKTVVHIGSWEHAQDAIEAGATAVTHFFDDEVVPDEVAQAWGKHKTISIPTLAVQCDMAKFVSQPQLLASPLLTDIEPQSALATYKNSAKFSKKAKETVKWQKDDYKNEVASLRKLDHNGVLMLAGSDSGNLGTFQGYSLHREMKLMQLAGYSNWQALAAGTTAAADFLGRPSGIENGDIAEMVILDADPTVDVANTQRIFAVIHHGALVDRKALKEAINQPRNVD